MRPQPISRRQFLKVTQLATLAAVTACAGQANNQEVRPSRYPPAPVPAGNRKRALRIAHLTDFHTTQLGLGEDGIVQALRQAQAQSDPPDILLNTGDSIMDAMEVPQSMVEGQWEVFNKLFKAECKLPAFHAIGNHDVLGWGWRNAPFQNDPLYGKEMALQQLGLSNRFYSFDRAGWRFIILDSTHLPNEASEHPYIGQIDDEQWDWLVKEIEATKAETPICIASHIPIVSACEYFDGENEASGNWVIPAAWVHIDARRMRQLFLQHPNVRVCLSGHTHQYESVDYLGVRYISSGAVCGDWWRGAYLDFPPAYVLVDLYEDGSAESQFVPYEGTSG